MNAILSFNLPDDVEDFVMATQAPQMHALLHDLTEELRRSLKHNTHPDWDDTTVEGIQKWLFEELSDRGVTLWH